MTEVNELYLTVLWWTLGLLAVAWVLLAGGIVALRKRTAEVSGVESAHSTFDVAWAIAPAVVVLLVAVPTIRGALAGEGSPEEAVTGTVFEMPEDKESADEPGIDTRQMDGGLATPASRKPSFPIACCESVRPQTKTEEDDTEQDDLVN